VTARGVLPDVAAVVALALVKRASRAVTATTSSDRNVPLLDISPDKY
jgi:hypothetical protein